MKVGSFEVEVDLTQPTTVRGLVWLIVSPLSVLFIILGDYQKVAALTTFAGTVVGALGFAVKDK